TPGARPARRPPPTPEVSPATACPPDRKPAGVSELSLRLSARSQVPAGTLCRGNNIGKLIGEMTDEHQEDGPDRRGGRGARRRDRAWRAGHAGRRERAPALAAADQRGRPRPVGRDGEEP